MGASGGLVICRACTRFWISAASSALRRALFFRVLPVDPATGKVAPGGIEEQTRQVLKNLQAILEASGSSLDHVVKCTVLMTDLTEFAAMNKVYAEFFKPPFPARATFQIGALALGVKIEIDCIAVKP